MNSYQILPNKSSSKSSSQNISLQAAKVKPAELILFTTQLSVMLDSGVVLSDALDAIAAQAEQGSFKMIIMDISEKVKEGERFSKVLAGYPKVFNSNSNFFFINSILLAGV